MEQLLAGPPVVRGLPGVTGEGGGDLLQVGPEELVRQADLLLQLGDQVLGVQRCRGTTHVSGQAVLLHHRVLERQDRPRPGVCRQRLVAGREPPRARLLPRLGGDQPLVAQLADRLGAQVPLGLVHGRRGEVGGHRGEGGPPDLAAREVRRRDHAEQSRLVGQRHRLEDGEPGPGVERVDRGVPLVGLDDDPAGRMGPGAVLGEPDGHAQQRRGEPRGALARCGWGDEQVHPHVAGLQEGVAREGAVLRVVGLDQRGRSTGVQHDEGVVVGVGRDGGVGGGHLVLGGGAHAPEHRSWVGHPGVQQGVHAVTDAGRSRWASMGPTGVVRAVGSSVAVLMTPPAGRRSGRRSGPPPGTPPCRSPG